MQQMLAFGLVHSALTAFAYVGGRRLAPARSNERKSAMRAQTITGLDAPPTADPTAYTLEKAAPSFVRSLRAANKTPATIRAYSSAVDLLDRYLATQGMPRAVNAIRREHIEAWLVSLQEAGNRPSSVNNRYRSLQQLWKWLADEGEITESPMLKMKAPTIPEEPPAILQPDEIARLLKVCEGAGFEERRDMAIFRLLLDTGIRLGELAGLGMQDVDVESDVIHVIGKGRRPRAVPFNRKAGLALDRYLRVRGTSLCAAASVSVNQSFCSAVGAATERTVCTNRCASARVKPRCMSRAMAMVGARPRPPWQWTYTTGSFSPPVSSSHSLISASCSRLGAALSSIGTRRQRMSSTRIRAGSSDASLRRSSTCVTPSRASCA